MQYITPQSLNKAMNTDISVNGFVQKIRKASGLYFIPLRFFKYTFRAVYIPDICKTPLNEMREGAYINASVNVKEEKRAPYGFELTLKSFSVLAEPNEDLPLNISLPALGCTLDETISNRAVSIKHPTEFAIMAIRGAVSFAFSEFMQRNGFIKIDTPKITRLHTDSEYINARYFGESAALSHSPSIYKIIATGGLDRVYETAAAFSSKNRNSLRHLNEYTRLDFELAYADGKTAMNVLKNVIFYIRDYVSKNCETELAVLGISVDTFSNIPEISHKSALAMLEKSENQPDLDPTDERKLCEYAKNQLQSDYIFITDISGKSRPIYEKNGKGFVLLSNGIEIASGGEHISDYETQRKKLETAKLSVSDYNAFLSAHKYGLPPMSGVGMGLERFIMALLSLENIRSASLFTRDLHHLVP